MRRIAAIATAALVASALPGCATQGPPYPEKIAEAGPPVSGHTRIILLRPDKRYDDYSLSRAVIRVNDAPLGKLAYGGFLYVDVTGDEVAIEASAKSRVYGVCKLRLPANAGDTLYVDVAPRPASIAADIVGTVAGAAIVGNAPSANTPAEVIVRESGVVGAAAGTAGSVAASKIESAGKECGGPYRLKPIEAPAALEHLTRLSWSG